MRTSQAASCHCAIRTYHAKHQLGFLNKYTKVYTGVHDFEYRRLYVPNASSNYGQLPEELDTLLGGPATIK